MKVRDSGMPEQKVWEAFFDPEQTLRLLGLDENISDVAEFGCGYGTFTLTAAKMIRGNIYAMDIEPEMIRITAERAQTVKLSNVQTVRCDFVEDGSGLADESVGYVMLFNILHVEQPEKLLQETRRILKKDGLLGIIHWNYDASTPRGPSLAIRPKPAQCIQWAGHSGFRLLKQLDLKPYHYGLLLTPF